MKHLTLVISITLFSISVHARQLRSGDVILQPLKCWSCNLIESQENSEFSHIGIVVEKGNNLWIAEAYGSVKLVGIKEFLAKTHPDKKNLVLELRTNSIDRFDLLASVERYIGNRYDREFRWDNFINGKEAIYCSELVYKVLAPFIKFHDLAPKRMKFDVNPEFWDRYFRGNTPRGELGISPEDFNQSTDFVPVEIEGI